MSFIVHMHGSRLKLSDADLIGEGGEARVYRFGRLAVKLFHAPSKLKAQKLAAFPCGLPAEVVAPTAAVHDGTGAVVGYAMPAVLGHEELARLANRRWREGAVPNARVVELFERLRSVLERLHQVGVVVGDLNDGNVLFDAGGEQGSPRTGPLPPGRTRVKLIDCDSMQYAGLPCGVGHQRTLAPELYGVDLSAAPRFTAATDWYAWNVLLFSSLLYVHPYGGVHRRLGTLLRRAEARHSVLEPDVAWPRSAVHFRVLPDDALQHFNEVFKHGRRAAPQLELQWTRCSCGLEHARAACPDCQVRGPAAARQALLSNGRCTARTMFSTSGRVLEASMQGGLRYVYEEGGVVRREDGSMVLAEPAAPGVCFSISGASTWVADRCGQLTRVVGGRVVERASTGMRGTAPVMTSTYRVEQEWIIEQQSGARVGQILEGQTWLWSGERLGLALYRAGDATHVGLLRHGKAGLLPVRHVPLGRGPVVSLSGRLAFATCVFDREHALLAATTEQGGRETHQLWLFNAAGQRLALGPAPGKGCALLDGRVVCATDQGLLSLRLADGVLVSGTLFTDSEPFVSASDELLSQSDGSLVVVSPKEILQLSLSP
jgi:hypothetical protein